MEPGTALSSSAGFYDSEPWTIPGDDVGGPQPGTIAGYHSHVREINVLEKSDGCLCGISRLLCAVQTAGPAPACGFLLLGPRGLCREAKVDAWGGPAQGLCRGYKVLVPSIPLQEVFAEKPRYTHGVPQERPLSVQRSQDTRMGCPRRSVQRGQGTPKKDPCLCRGDGIPEQGYPAAVD